MNCFNGNGATLMLILMWRCLSMHAQLTRSPEITPSTVIVTGNGLELEIAPESTRVDLASGLGATFRVVNRSDSIFRCEYESRVAEHLELTYQNEFGELRFFSYRNLDAPASPHPIAKVIDIPGGGSHTEILELTAGLHWRDSRPDNYTVTVSFMYKDIKLTTKPIPFTVIESKKRRG
jgi:hypothetical protein